MKSLLIILPLLFWFGCEDENKSDNFVFVDEWVECKILSYTSAATDGSYFYEYIFNWSGNSYESYENGELLYTVDNNDYGRTVRSVSASGEVSYHVIFDRWKISESGYINSNGDTTDVDTYVWDGLTATQKKSNSTNFNNSRITYNEYGLKVESYLIYSGTDSLFNHEIFNYENDGRRLKNSTVDGQLVEEIEWNGNEYERILYNYYTAEPTSKLIGNVNEYYKDETYKLYSYEDGIWNLLETSVLEYECPGFEQIYP